jgi:hypothetical protein
VAKPTSIIEFGKLARPVRRAVFEVAVNVPAAARLSSNLLDSRIL